MTYNPFGAVPISELTASDLAVLAEVPEGWFIEYKREPCKAKDYAKEASAFANSMGGWIFVGIEEDSSTRKPAYGPGLQNSEATRLQDSARDAIFQNLSPSPKIELAVVRGPIPALSVPTDRCILVINIPESQNTPHIHSSGKIYRRQADKSEPVEITDRAELDALYKRAKRMRSRIDKRLNQGFDRAWADTFDTPWLHCALTPDPAHSRRPRLSRLSEFRDLIVSQPQGAISLPDVYSSALGFVARNHREQAVPHGAALTLEYGLDGSVYITIPLSSICVEDGHQKESFLNKNSGIKFMNILRKSLFNNARVIDCTYIVMSLLGMQAHIQQILAAAKVNEKYLIRVQMKNVFRCVPFFDSEAYLNYCTERLIPIVHHGEFNIPPQRRRWLDMNNIFDKNALLEFIIPVLFSLGLGEDIMPIIVEQTIQSAYSRKKGSYLEAGG